MRLLMLWGALACGCAGSLGAPEEQSPLVTSLELDFPSRERGQLAFEVRVPQRANGLASVTWELMLSGVRFASGVEGSVPLKAGLVEVKASLPSRHLTWRDGEGWLDVTLEGSVDLAPQRFLFRERRDLRVHHRPQLFDERVIK